MQESDHSSGKTTVEGAGRRSESKVSITHVKECFPCRFDAFDFKLKSLLGRFSLVDVGLAQTDAKTAIDLFRASQGEQDLMLFDSTAHGQLFWLNNQPARKASRYHIGNPLFALKMMQESLSVALYAPLSVLAYEVDDTTVCVEYDLPSTSFGQFGQPAVDVIAQALDKKLHALLLKAASA